MSSHKKKDEEKEEAIGRGPWGGHSCYMFAAGGVSIKIDSEEEWDALGPEWFDHPPTDEDLGHNDKEKD